MHRSLTATQLRQSSCSEQLGRKLLPSKLQEQAWESAPVDRALSFPTQTAWQEGQLPLSQRTEGCVTLGETFKNIFIFVYVCDCMLHVCRYLWMLEDGVRFPGTGISGSYGMLGFQVSS